jgi:predicted GNAT family acetyltransferase
MEIQQTTNGSTGCFYIEDGNGKIANLSYKMNDAGCMVIEHTEVMPEGNGKGLGKQLVALAVEFARQHHIKIIPVCPFARKIIEKIPEYHDVLLKD